MRSCQGGNKTSRVLMVSSSIALGRPTSQLERGQLLQACFEKLGEYIDPYLSVWVDLLTFGSAAGFSDDV